MILSFIPIDLGERRCIPSPLPPHSPPSTPSTGPSFLRIQIPAHHSSHSPAIQASNYIAPAGRWDGDSSPPLSIPLFPSLPGLSKLPLIHLKDIDCVFHLGFTTAVPSLSALVVSFISTGPYSNLWHALVLTAIINVHGQVQRKVNLRKMEVCHFNETTFLIILKVLYLFCCADFISPVYSM